jgi:ribonuclease Y
MRFLAAEGEDDEVTHAVGAHHYEIEPATPEAMLVIIADTASAARPGARRESLELHVQRLSSLESLAMGFPGVDRAYVVKAGREIRVVVRPSEIDDLATARLATEIARAVEASQGKGNPVRVTVIRETRATETTVTSASSRSVPPVF